jgi:hypothetical protein
VLPSRYTRGSWQTPSDARVTTIAATLASFVEYFNV